MKAVNLLMVWVCLWSGFPAVRGATDRVVITFEEFQGRDGAAVGDYYPGIRFEEIENGQDWIVADITAMKYDDYKYCASSWPSGGVYAGMNCNNMTWWNYGWVCAWADEGPETGRGGRVLFNPDNTLSVEMGYCSSHPLYLEAYDAAGHLIDSATGPANVRYHPHGGNQNGPGTLRVEAPHGTLIDSVIVHDSGGTWVADNMVIHRVLTLDKTDGVDDGDCLSPGDELVYTLSWENISGRAIPDANLMDILPAEVSYDYVIGTSPPAVDTNYDPASHTYTWSLGILPAGGSGSVSLPVTVNETAAPGLPIYNTAEMWGTVYDVNEVPYEALIARATEETSICCWSGNVIFVDPGAIAGNRTGVDWENAYLRLQDAFYRVRHSICSRNFKIYVAEETYSPGPDEDDSFVIPDHVELYGGFPTGGCDFKKRDPKRYPTILSGSADN